MEVEQKYEMLRELSGEWANCEKCGLCKGRTNVVFGEGNPQASLMIVGEAPGENEDHEGVPFVGASGQVFDKLLRSFNSNRDEVFITNVVACRPTENGKNRPPAKAEIEACKERLHKIIEIVDPTVLLLLGSTAAKALTSIRSITSVAKDPSIPRLVASTPGQCITVQRDAFATFHPSYLLRHPDETEGSPMHRSYETWQKALKVADNYNEIYWGTPLPSRE